METKTINGIEIKMIGEYAVIKELHSRDNTVVYLGLNPKTLEKAVLKVVSDSTFDTKNPIQLNPHRLDLFDFRINLDSCTLLDPTSLSLGFVITHRCSHLSLFHCPRSLLLLFHIVWKFELHSKFFYNHNHST